MKRNVMRSACPRTPVTDKKASFLRLMKFEKSGVSLLTQSRLLLFSFLIFGLVIWGCDDDNEKSWSVDSDPVFVLKATEIHAAQGRTIQQKLN